MGAVLVVVMVVVAAGLLIWWQRGGSRDARPDWQPPPQTLLASSLSVQPVPGWRARVTDLGLPAGSRMATSDEPFHSQPLVGYLGDHAYFVASSTGAPTHEWWLLGIDVRDGRRLFAPVPLNTAITAPPECFLNGPTMVLCLRNDAETGTAWVIDAETGTASFTGPTDLRTYPGKLGVTQIGIYAVAEAMDKGVYGIGTTAEPTWFVPGSGSVSDKYRARSPFAPPTLAAQTVAGRGADRQLVFSVVNGTVITPTVDKGVYPQDAVIYPGGFAVAFTNDPRPSVPDGFMFFDSTGRRLGRVDVPGLLSRDSPDVPVPIIDGFPNAIVFTPDGRKLLEIAQERGFSRAVLIGTTLFVRNNDGAYPVWQQYDLTTGAKGKACEFDVDNYLGYDGSIAVFKVYNPQAGLTAVARNPATCEVAWKIPAQVRSFAEIWRLNTTLVQLSDDGTELMSLVAPS